MTLLLTQMAIILLITVSCGWLALKIGQARVIGEIIGGILIGPSVFGRFAPHLSAKLFPISSFGPFETLSTVGLVLFLFLVGLEVNVNLFMSNWRVALSVGLGGMLLPFGLGCAIAWGLYNEFHTDPDTVPISFPVYMLFIGTALAVSLHIRLVPQQTDSVHRSPRSPFFVEFSRS